MSLPQLKALVLSGGAGNRLKPLTHTTTKQLLPVGNKPVLFHILDLVNQVGISETVLVVSRQWGEQVRVAIMGSAYGKGLVTFRVQDNPAGLAHAVAISETDLGGAGFLMVLGDNVYDFDIQSYLHKFLSEQLDALILLKEVKDPQNRGIAEMAPDGTIKSVAEKPKNPKSNLGFAGMYLFSPAIHTAIRQIKPSSRGELEITDAVQRLIEMNKRVKGFMLEGWWIDTGTETELLLANQRILEREVRATKIHGTCDQRSQIIGNVEIMKGTRIQASTIIGPVSIAENCTITDSKIGPFVSVGENTVIKGSQVANTIIMDHCDVDHLLRLEESVVGRHVCMTMKGDDSRKISLLLGDHARLSL